MEENTLKLCVKGAIPPTDKGVRTLQKEYQTYKNSLIPQVQEAVKRIIKDRNIQVYAQQKWMVLQYLDGYLKRLPLHPMAFHRQSVYISQCVDCVADRDVKPANVTCDKCPYNPSNGRFWIHFKTKQDDGEAVCYLHIPQKYRSLIEKACGKNNPILGQVELIEDKKYGWINCHIVLRLPKPTPYEPKGWMGVDVGWNKLATSILATINPHLTFSHPTIHGKNFKTQIIQLRHLLKDYARKGKAWKKWDFRLKHTIKYTTGAVAKEIIEKAKKHKAGVAMESLTFQSYSKRWLIPRYKLMIAVKTLCERDGIPFRLVSAKNTSITCPKCRYTDNKNRVAERFTCLKCGYQADADIVGAMNIATIGIGLTPIPKEARLHAETSGYVAKPLSTFMNEGANPRKQKRGEQTKLI